MTEEEEAMIYNQRKRVVGEEKRIMEEMKRQQEIDVMLEIMRKSQTKGNTDPAQNITFDYEGKII